MPARPSRACSVPRCPLFAPCPTHRPGQRSVETAARDRFYHTAAWLKFRSWFRRATCVEAGCVGAHQASHALCQDCHAEGHVEAARDFDHIVPRADGGAPLDPRNIRGLCKSHHSQRTMTALNRGRNPRPSAQ